MMSIPDYITNLSGRLSIGAGTGIGATAATLPWLDGVSKVMGVLVAAATLVFLVVSIREKVGGRKLK